MGKSLLAELRPEHQIEGMDQPTDPPSGIGDLRLFAPATQRNRVPILEVLMRVLPARGLALEVASGTGEHAIWFAQNLRPLVWQPSDPDPEMRESIQAHGTGSDLNTLKPPVDLDVTRHPWPIEQADAVVCINMVHIAPWAATLGLLQGAAACLPSEGPLFLYGPFKRAGEHTADSNAAFDASLRSQNPAWGVRDLDEISKTAEGVGLLLSEVVEMPANNLSVVFRKVAPA